MNMLMFGVYQAGQAICLFCLPRVPLPIKETPSPTISPRMSDRADHKHIPSFCKCGQMMYSWPFTVFDLLITLNS